MNLIESTIGRISEAVPAPDLERAVRDRWDRLTKPRGSLGLLEDCVVRLSRIQGKLHPVVDRQAVYVFCGDHGITQEGVSAYPSVVTREMVKNFLRGGAAINVLCRSLGIATHIVDAGVAGPKIPGTMDYRVAEGTENFARAPAMSRDQTIVALENGIHIATAASKTYELVGLGEMGIGNSTAATALLCAVTGISPKQATGRGAGLDNVGLHQKIAVVSRALAFHDLRSADPILILSTFGGFEIATMTGFLLGSAASRLPVVVDGFISSAAFLCAQALAPALNDFVIFGHQSTEPGHQHILSRAQANPLLSLGMRLGEGTGAALAMHLLRSSTDLYEQMATFEEAAVSDIATGD